MGEEQSNFELCSRQARGIGKNDGEQTWLLKFNLHDTDTSSHTPSRHALRFSDLKRSTLGKILPPRKVQRMAVKCLLLPSEISPKRHRDSNICLPSAIILTSPTSAKTEQVRWQVHLAALRSAMYNIMATTCSLRRVNDVSSSDLALVHQVVHLLQLAQANDLEWCLDDATAEELNGLGRVLAVTDV